MANVRIEGADEFRALSRRLKEAGRKDLRRELFKAINSATKPARQAVIEQMPSFMPDDYASVLSGDLKMTASKQASKSPKVSIKAKGKRKTRLLGPLERGRLRHPLFGNRDHWYGQKVDPHFFTLPMHSSAPQAAEDILAAMERINEQITEE